MFDERSLLRCPPEGVAHHHQEKTLVTRFQSGQSTYNGSYDFPNVANSMSSFECGF